MAKAAATSGKVDIEGLQKDLLAFSGKASAGIDTLLEEIKDIRAKADERVKLIQEQINPLNEMYKSATGRYYIATSTGASNGKKAGEGRKRRSRDELTVMAGEVVEFIKAAGKDGVSGSDIKGKFGPLLPSTNVFLKEYAPDAKVKTTGEKAQMRYTA